MVNGISSQKATIECQGLLLSDKEETALKLERERQRARLLRVGISEEEVRVSELEADGSLAFGIKSSDSCYFDEIAGHAEDIDEDEDVDVDRLLDIDGGQEEDVYDGLSDLGSFCEDDMKEEAVVTTDVPSNGVVNSEDMHCEQVMEQKAVKYKIKKSKKREVKKQKIAKVETDNSVRRRQMSYKEKILDVIFDVLDYFLGGVSDEMITYGMYLVCCLIGSFLGGMLDSNWSVYDARHVDGIFRIYYMTSLMYMYRLAEVVVDDGWGFKAGELVGKGVWYSFLYLLGYGIYRRYSCRWLDYIL